MNPIIYTENRYQLTENLHNRHELFFTLLFRKPCVKIIVTRRKNKRHAHSIMRKKAGWALITIGGRKEDGNVIDIHILNCCGIAYNLGISLTKPI